MILLGFPLQSWSLWGFMSIENCIGLLILIEEELLLGNDWKFPRMLVEIDIDEGIPSDIEVV